MIKMAKELVDKFSDDKVKLLCSIDNIRRLRIANKVERKAYAVRLAELKRERNRGDICGDYNTVSNCTQEINALRWALRGAVSKGESLANRQRINYTVALPSVEKHIRDADEIWETMKALNKE